MATETSGNSNGFLYFIVGVLLVGVVVLGVMFFNGGLPGAQSPTERAIDRTADAIGDAADKIGDSATKPAQPSGG
jgi:hypothetical protein